jgi:hypothetical protein
MHDTARDFSQVRVRRDLRQATSTQILKHSPIDEQAGPSSSCIMRIDMS